MASAADAIPDLERLLRDVFRRVLGAELGSDWINRLSRGAQDEVTRAARIARTKRPTETLVDDWDAVGLPALRATLATDQTWDAVKGRLANVWASREMAQVDLQRLDDYRGKNLHNVGPPSGGIQDAEVASMVLRLRLGFEAVRRELDDDTGEWWPYIEAVHSNVDEWSTDRKNLRGMPRTRLNEGDLVRIQVVGINPGGRQEDLRYRMSTHGAAEVTPADGKWMSTDEFHFEVARSRLVRVHIQVADAESLEEADVIGLYADVRPL